jgi:hypothetical protein
MSRRLDTSTVIFEGNGTDSNRFGLAISGYNFLQDTRPVSSKPVSMCHLVGSRELLDRPIDDVEDLARPVEPIPVLASKLNKHTIVFQTIN